MDELSSYLAAAEQNALCNSRPLEQKQLLYAFPKQMAQFDGWFAITLAMDHVLYAKHPPAEVLDHLQDWSHTVSVAEKTENTTPIKAWIQTFKVVPPDIINLSLLPLLFFPSAGS